MERKVLVLAVAVVGMMLSCSGNSGKKQVEEPAREPFTWEEHKNERPAEAEPKGQGGEYSVVPYTDSYEDGYEDGQAAAEEDRLAGRPFMQAGGDDGDDDDDYEDGYDDGYEDY